VNPHYSIGLRSGLFMNAICSFFNIITPFRLGELYRFKFMATRYKSPPVISTLAITIERLIDAIFLIASLLLLSNRNVVKASAAQIIFIALIVGGCFLAYSLKAKPMFSYSLSQWTRQLTLITRTTFKKILFSGLGIWSLYLVSGYFSCKLLSTEVDNWLEWNTTSYRLFNFDQRNFQPSQQFNVLFVFSFLLIGLSASLMGHKSNRITDLLNGSNPDSSQRTPLAFESRSRFMRTIFLESPLENYWRKTSISGAIGTIFNGGSGALVYSLNADAQIVRKVGFGYQKYRLEDQFNFMESFTDLWAFPQVKRTVMTDTHFEFDMELLSDSIPYYVHLTNLKSDEMHFNECLRIFKFIEAGNKPSRTLEPSEYRAGLENLWSDKLHKIIDEIYVRIPILSENDYLVINGIRYKSLTNIYYLLKQLALKVDPILDESNPHGDSTLSNLLLIKSDLSIRSIDPNPNQLVRNSSIDHGKVLQSLLTKYEDSLVNECCVVLTRREITYTPVVNAPIENCGRHYLDILEKNKSNSIAAELMCFSSMLRLLPYRMNHDFRKAPLFLAQTIEFGNLLIDKYEK
jgi:hypothetical protein